MANQFQQKPLSNLEIAEFCNQMGLMLRAGISSPEALHLLLQDASNAAERELLSKLITDTENTGYLHEAAASAGVFPAYTTHMLKLGEETGTLDKILESLAGHYTREENLAGMIRSALLYPSIMLGMMVLVILVLLTKVLPIFNQVFLQLGQEMTGFSAGLLQVGSVLSHYSVVFVVLILVFAAVLFFGRKQLPFQRSIQEKMAACRFADGMSIALKSGMTPEQGLELTDKLVENEAFEKKLADCSQKLSEGMDFSQALHESGIFTGPYARMAFIAGKAGVMDEAMAQIASEYEYSAQNRITNLIAMLEPTLVIILSLIVGVILFSVMLPLLGIMSGL